MSWIRTTKAMKEWITYPEFIYLVYCVVDILNAGKSNSKTHSFFIQISINFSKNEVDGCSSYYMDGGKPPQ